jgi:hypothetical protein
MNLTDMRILVRRDLHDEATGNYRWTNDELDRHINRAVKDLSEHIPLEEKSTGSTTAGSREIDIAAVTDRVMVAAVEYPVGRLPKVYQPFSLWGDVITLLGDEVPNGSDAYIYYGKLHTLDASGTTIPGYLWDTVTAGACGYAAIEWAVYAVNRINVSGDGVPKEFQDWGRWKLDYFRRELKRLGRRHRVRTGSLYKSWQPAVSESVDFGP